MTLQAYDFQYLEFLQSHPSLRTKYLMVAFDEYIEENVITIIITTTMYAHRRCIFLSAETGTFYLNFYAHRAITARRRFCFISQFSTLKLNP